jgi:hypothetical protein
MFLLAQNFSQGKPPDGAGVALLVSNNGTVQFPASLALMNIPCNVQVPQSLTDGISDTFIEPHDVCSRNKNKKLSCNQAAHA